MVIHRFIIPLTPREGIAGVGIIGVHQNGKSGL